MSGEGDAPRWSDEDRALLRALGGRVSQIIHGEDLELEDLQRRDELGILANMVSRLARELGAARRRDRQHRAELEQQVAQLQAAYDTQERLLAAVRRFSSPILEPHQGILLLPIAGPLLATSLLDAMPALLERLTATRPVAVIVHPTVAEPIPSDAAIVLLRLEQSARHSGARLILSGVPAHLAGAGGLDVSRLTPCLDLQDALTTALDLLDLRIRR